MKRKLLLLALALVLTLILLFGCTVISLQRTETFEGQVIATGVVKDAWAGIPYTVIYFDDGNKVYVKGTLTFNLYCYFKVTTHRQDNRWVVDTIEHTCRGH